MISKGALWVVKGGKEVKVWRDAWIPGLRQNKLSMQVGVNVNWDLTAEDLIDQESGERDLCYLQGKVSQEEMEAILRIPIPLSDGPDKLIWPHDGKGVLTAKSAYACIKATKMRVTDYMPPSSHVTDPLVWKNLQNIECPEKIRSFLWRAFVDALAVGSGLKKRYTVQDARRHFCGQDETVEHTLLSCVNELSVFGLELWA